VTSLLGTIDFHRREDGLVIAYELRKNDDEHQNYSFLRVNGGRVTDLFNDIPYTYYGHQDDQEISQSGNYRTQRVNGSNYRELVFEYDFTESRGGNKPTRQPRSFRLRARWRAGKYRWVDGGALLKRLNAERNRVGSI
ncbi:MAG: hypothetical protein ABIZ95_16660, partial [Pyrinomonadaceae bacterium]